MQGMTTVTDKNSAEASGREVTKDARGRRYRQLDPVTMYVFRPIRLHLLQREDVIPAESLREITRQVDPRAIMGWWVVVGSSVLGVLAILIVNIVYFSFHSSWSRFSLFLGVMYGAALIILLVTPWFGMTAGRPIRAPRVLPVMLRHRRCPHCGYDLRNLEADPADQATVCPECGCAWRLDAVAMAEYTAVAESPFRPWANRSGKVMIALSLLLLLAGVAGFLARL